MTAATHGSWAAEHGDVLAAQHVAKYSFAGIRLLLGFEFLWVFADKTFGWGVGMHSENAWLTGGSPAEDYLSGVEGPFAGFFGSLAGSAVVDWVFMIGMLGIGLALVLGIGMRVAAATGALLLLLMWLASIPIAWNPFVDFRLIYALLLVALAAVSAGDTLGLGRWWAGLGIVKRFPALR